MTSSHKSDALYLGHMLDMARKAAERLGSQERLAYDADEDLRLALTHLVQVIGEAASRVSAEFRSAHPEIPWASIIGMRHRIVHDYLNVDEDIVWSTVTQELPRLVEQLGPLVA